MRQFALLLAVSLACSPPEGGAAEEPIHIVLLHTNDIHGQILPVPASWTGASDPPLTGGLPRLAAEIRRVRREAEESSAGVLLVDAGDWSQGTPEGRLEQGRPVIELLARLGYDAMAVGNHEFDHGAEVLSDHLDELELPALLANARTVQGELVPGTRDHLITECAGLRVALVGLLTEHAPLLTHASAADLRWTAPADSFGELRARLEGEVDLIVPVTHEGIEADRVLARAHPDLPLIVGGHTHTFLPQGTREGTVLIVQAGSKTAVLGRVDLWIDPRTHHVLRSSAELISLEGEAAQEDRDMLLEEACAGLVAETWRRMDVVVGTVTGPLSRGWDPVVSTPAGNLITDLMRARTGADVAVHNRGGLRRELPAGPLTRRNVFQMLPFENYLVTMDIRAAQLQELIERSVSGSSLSPLDVSGLDVSVAQSGGETAIVGLRLAGAELSDDEYYRLTTNSFLATGGDGYGVLRRCENRVVDPILLSELLEQAFHAGALTPSAENRFHVE